MATFGEALAALEDFRTDLVHEQMNAPVAEAMAFRPAVGIAGETPFRNIHATGVGRDFLRRIALPDVVCVARDGERRAEQLRPSGSEPADRMFDSPRARYAERALRGSRVSWSPRL